MITTFEVGAVFKIINDASPALQAILKEIRSLNTAMKKASAGLDGLGTKISGLRIGGATGQVEALATAWANVARAAGDAGAAMGVASRVGRVHRSGGNSGPHNVPSVPLPDGGYAGVGWGAAQDAEIRRGRSPVEGLRTEGVDVGERRPCSHAAAIW